MEGVNWFQIIVGGVVLVVGAVGTLGGWTWIRVKLNELTQDWATRSGLDFLSSLDEWLTGFAVQIYHEEIKILQAAGKWSPELGKAMLQKLLDVALAHFGIGNVAKRLGVDASKVRSLVESRAELAVGEAKRRGRMAKAAKDPSKP